MKRIALLILFLPLLASSQAPQGISAARLQAAWSQGYSEGVQSQQGLMRELQAEIDRLNTELKKLKEP